LPITPQIVRPHPDHFELGLHGHYYAFADPVFRWRVRGDQASTYTDYILRSIAILLISIPSFWLGTLVVLYDPSGGLDAADGVFSLFKNLPGTGMMNRSGPVLGGGAKPAER